MSPEVDDRRGERPRKSAATPQRHHRATSRRRHRAHAYTQARSPSSGVARPSAGIRENVMARKKDKKAQKDKKDKKAQKTQAAKGAPAAAETAVAPFASPRPKKK
jgi:hypothetical protein